MTTLLTGTRIQATIGLIHDRIEPIYWAPFFDAGNIVRATWFYKESMLPVETDVANMLEVGYLKLQPWSTTWREKVRTAVETGASVEEKLVHSLWPDDLMTGKAPASTTEDTSQIDDYLSGFAEQAVNRVGDRDELGTMAFGKASYGRDGQRRSYLKAKVLYADQQDAYVLDGNADPFRRSRYTPTQRIRYGFNTGVHVVRGFDRAKWIEKNTDDKDSKLLLAEIQKPLAGKQVNIEVDEEPDKPAVTDLVLAIHGIGQKFSMSSDEWHFTHAMNSFRRAVDKESKVPEIRALTRKNFQLAVIPVNWRTDLVLDGIDKNETESDTQFSLEDITPYGAQPLRKMLSDIVLDVPFYLSENKAQMLSALVKEANRIYELWCKYNPDFNKEGRVHIIGHSLGSAMALDVLSNQPTSVANYQAEKNSKHFAFDTQNLYLCGSPVGLFLLLQKSVLRPRNDTHIAAHLQISDSTDEDTTPKQGTYGCVAVSNIYNVINPFDVIATHLNPAIDVAYAKALTPAYLPSTYSPWYSNKFLEAFNTTTIPTPNNHPEPVSFPTDMSSSNSAARSHAYALNDNGQIDYLMHDERGAIEPEPMKLLTAHSGYWTAKDFIRFIVLETGRPLGRESTYEIMRAVSRS